jgi:hypothetical protein
VALSEVPGGHDAGSGRPLGLGGRGDGDAEGDDGAEEEGYDDPRAT